MYAAQLRSVALTAQKLSALPNKSSSLLRSTDSPCWYELPFAAVRLAVFVNVGEQGDDPSALDRLGEIALLLRG